MKSDSGEDSAESDFVSVGEESHSGCVGHQAQGEKGLAVDSLHEKRNEGKDHDFRHLADGHEADASHSEHLVHGLDEISSLGLDSAEEFSGMEEIELVDAGNRDCQ